MAEPYCLAMVLCDAVHRDPSTGKFTILGTFDSFIATDYPAQVNLWVYFAVTDGVGPCTMRVQLVEAKVGPIDPKLEGEIPGRVFSVQSAQDFRDPLRVHEQVLGTTFLIEHPGVYLCELWANDNMLMQRRFVARKRKTGTG